MKMQRLTKIFMCLAMGLYAAIVAYDNLVDAEANFTFLKHVLSMDTTLPGSALRTRAITSPLLHEIVYGGIIATEAGIGVLYLTAAASLWRARAADAAEFDAAKRWIQVASIAGFGLWFGGFEIVGGEWFAMWQSPHWNGQQPAFRFYMTMLAVLIFVSQPEPADATDRPT